MNHLNKELGLVRKPTRQEDWTYADGEGVAKVKLNLCRKKCSVKHPFNYSKRNACENVCEAAYREKMRQIQIKVDAYTATDLAIAQQTGSQAPLTSSKPSRPSNETSENRTSETQEVEVKKGLSTGAKVAIGVGVLALAIGAVVYFKRKK